jgi:TolB-like protein
MQIWSAEIKELESLYTSIKGRFPELEKELEQLIKFDDANVILIYSRRCLEVIITDLCECELKRPRKTEPLKGIIDKLNHEEKVPSHIIASMEGLNSLSTFGAHPKDFDPEQVRPILLNLATIIKWYVKYKDTQIISQIKPEEAKHESKEPVDTRKGIRNPKKKLILLLTGLFLVIAVVVGALFVFSIIGRGKQTKEIEKSIAVLPFKLLSDEPDKQYLADGMMDAILLHLSKIEDLRVMSRTSMEQYRESNKTMPEIGREQGVEYLLEGSFQKSGDNVRLIVQLIKASKDTHVWSNEYDRNWNDIYSVQSEVAQTIATELKAAITPQEKQLIEKTPTTNLTAYDFYQRGKQEERKYSSVDLSTKPALNKAEKMYKTALEYDSSFAQAYMGLANIYWLKHYSEEYFSEGFMDSAIILTNIALSYNDQLDEAYTYRGNYYRIKGLSDQAIKDFDKAIKINPNSWEAYNGKAEVFWNEDILNYIDNLQIAASLNHGLELPGILRGIADGYNSAGFIEKARYYNLEALKLDEDSAEYFRNLGEYERDLGNYRKSVEFLERSYQIDTTYIWTLYQLGKSYLNANPIKKSLKYLEGYIAKGKTLGMTDYGILHRVGYAYWKNGNKKEAEYYFNKCIDECNDHIKSDRPWAHLYYIYYDMAGVYAFMGDKNKAYENLKIFNKKQKIPLWMVTLIKNDPLFDSLRNESEFQQIVRDVEAKYQAEHERVRKWLEEQGE